VRDPAPVTDINTCRVQKVLSGVQESVRGRRRSALTLLQPAKAGLATAPWRGRPREPAEATLKYRAGSSAAARQAQSDVENDDDRREDQQAKHGGPCPAQWVCGHGADTRLFGRRWEGS